MKTEDDYLSEIHELKWGNGFKCKHCKSKAAPYDRPNYGKRCSKCGKEESVLSNTMFEGSRLPINKWFQLLNYIQEILHEYILLKYHIKSLNQFKDKDFLATRIQFEEIIPVKVDYTEKKNVKSINNPGGLREAIKSEEPCRESLAELSQHCGVTENTIAKVFERIYEWLPKEARTWLPPWEEWFKGLKDKHSKNVYEALFNFICTTSRETEYHFPDENMMLKLAVLKKQYHRDKDNFEDRW